MNSMLTSIDRKLRDWEIAWAIKDAALARTLCNEIFKVVLTPNLDLWDERILLAIERLLDQSPPNKKVHGEVVQVLRERTQKVCAINDLFYHIIEPEAEIQQIVARLSHFIDLSNAGKEKLCADGQLRTVREALVHPSEKIAEFVHYAAQESHTTTDQHLRDFEACVQAVQEREIVGTAKALLVHRKAHYNVPQNLDHPIS